MADDAALVKLLQERDLGVLATLKRDGRPQLSNVNYHFDAASRLIRVSITADRAKARNLRRDPRASLHVSAPDGWSYAVAEGTAELSEVAADPHDAAVEELVAVYRDIRGEHPDWDEYRRVMVQDGRLVVKLHVEHLYGMAR
ncbi:TIGR03618 family F420-dependent PPOX class oxidoreductase [Actinomadura sp. LD22]|uniref:TIGR03618 family F420-dependent PPOX class oxidoreductase n=1 Tax=Actinomadura physcomitrii TaxID=2650748 RepID=A0A6I4M982_9ACTN|nr:PPOX class F420-dependent oxidoreductase [Actinomadura physcomitrii]MWA00975.1 TIGR03618 family F420-dependent PPOX class oxidoreductase [Actinomadura physcomitrii]